LDKLSKDLKRATSNDQKNDLYNQLERLKALHPSAVAFSDIRSQIQQKSNELPNKIENNEINNIYITRRDRLARFGFNRKYMQNA